MSSNLRLETKVSVEGKMFKLLAQSIRTKLSWIASLSMGNIKSPLNFTVFFLSLLYQEIPLVR